ncbi:hypothetical protein [Bacillus sp. J33]|uniref:hypothetical protein n=1 Tax=Bacillus sp. J33 TaxID=935836 RepID=UPI00047C6483|nr:hypothetical protein [Bacillus sp. J33]
MNKVWKVCCLLFFVCYSNIGLGIFIIFIYACSQKDWMNSFSIFLILLIWCYGLITIFERMVKMNDRDSSDKHRQALQSSHRMYYPEEKEVEVMAIADALNNAFDPGDKSKCV